LPQLKRLKICSVQKALDTSQPRTTSPTRMSVGQPDLLKQAAQNKSLERDYRVNLTLVNSAVPTQLTHSEFQQSSKSLSAAMERRGRELQRKPGGSSERPRHGSSPATTIKSEASSTVFDLPNITAVPYSIFDEAMTGRKNGVCGNCQRQGHEVLECVKVDAHGMVNACPIHNTTKHNLWSCPTRATLSKGMVFECLFELRRGIPQLAWGEDISVRYPGALFSNDSIRGIGRRPLSRLFALELARRNPQYWKSYTYHAVWADRLKWYDCSWDNRFKLETQIHPSLQSLGHRISYAANQIVKREASVTSARDLDARRRRSMSPSIESGRVKIYRSRSRSRSPVSFRSHDDGRHATQASACLPVAKQKITVTPVQRFVSAHPNMTMARLKEWAESRLPTLITAVDKPCPVPDQETGTSKGGPCAENTRPVSNTATQIKAAEVTEDDRIDIGKEHICSMRGAPSVHLPLGTRQNTFLR